MVNSGSALIRLNWIWLSYMDIFQQNHIGHRVYLLLLLKAIANSLCFGLYKNNRQIGFARLVTDKATFAYLADVFVLEEHRGQGLSKWLIEVIQSHPELQGLRRWMLMTRDAQGLYEQFGWTVLDEDARLRSMQRHFKEVYKGMSNQ